MLINGIELRVHETQIHFYQIDFLCQEVPRQLNEERLIFLTSTAVTTEFPCIER